MAGRHWAEFLATLENLLGRHQGPSATLGLLITETVRYRDKVKEESGEILTVGDTRVALDALEKHLNGRPIPDGLTDRQRELVNLWIKRLQFGSGE